MINPKLNSTKYAHNFDCPPLKKGEMDGEREREREGRLAILA